MCVLQVVIYNRIVLWRFCVQLFVFQFSSRFDLCIVVDTYDNCHTFNWTETELLGRAQTKHAREFKEAWYSIDGNTINRHVEIPTVYLQLKTTRKCPANNNDTMTNTNFQITIPSTSATQQSKHSNDAIPSSGIHSTMTTHSSTSNEIRSTTEQPIRRSQRIQERSNTAKL